MVFVQRVTHYPLPIPPIILEISSVAIFVWLFTHPRSNNGTLLHRFSFRMQIYQYIHCHRNYSVLHLSIYPLFTRAIVYLSFTMVFVVIPMPIIYDFICIAIFDSNITNTRPSAVSHRSPTDQHTSRRCCMCTGINIHTYFPKAIPLVVLPISLVKVTNII